MKVSRNKAFFTHSMGARLSSANKESFKDHKVPRTLAEPCTTASPTPPPEFKDEQFKHIKSTPIPLHFPL